MADTARARRLAKRIVTIVATELEHQVKDPRLAMITITAATVTPDLREATVYYTVYGDETEQQSTAQALASANGVLRTAVGRQTGIKFTPTLAFKPDAVPETSRQMEELIAAAKASDAAVAEKAAGASYAGEPDPYRSPREIEDDEAADGEFADNEAADGEFAEHEFDAPVEADDDAVDGNPASAGSATALRSDAVAER